MPCQTFSKAELGHPKVSRLAFATKAPHLLSMTGMVIIFLMGSIFSWLKLCDLYHTLLNHQEGERACCEMYEGSGFDYWIKVRFTAYKADFII